MRKKGFIKSVEAVIIVVMIMSIYLILTEPVYKPVQQFKRDLGKISESFIQMLSNIGLLKRDLTSFDILDINAKAEIILPERHGYQITLKYGTSLNIFNNEAFNKTERILHFAYNFPKYVDKNSACVYSKEYWVDTFVNWTWHEIEITIQNNESSLKNDLRIPINLTLTANEDVSNSTLVFFEDEDVLDYSIQDWNMTNPKAVNASLIFEVPQITEKGSKKIFLFYSTSSPFNASEYQKSMSESSQGVITRASNPQESSRGDVYFRLPLILPNENKTFHLSYQIGSLFPSTYNTSMAAYNNTGFLFDLDENFVKEGTAPFTASLPLEYNTFKKTYYTGTLDSQIILHLWSIWQ